MKMSYSELNAVLKKMGRTPVPVPVSNKRKPAKYRNVRVYVYKDGYVSHGKCDGHGRHVSRYDSIKEYERYQELCAMQKAGLISGLRRQVSFILQEGFVGPDGKKHRAICYAADAVYIDRNGKEVVEDVKAFDAKTGKYRCTETFLLKWKLLQAKYPDKNFVIY